MTRYYLEPLDAWVEAKPDHYYHPSGEVHNLIAWTCGVYQMRRGTTKGLEKFLLGNGLPATPTEPHNKAGLCLVFSMHKSSLGHGLEETHVHTAYQQTPYWRTTLDAAVHESAHAALSIGGLAALVPIILTPQTTSEMKRLGLVPDFEHYAQVLQRDPKSEKPQLMEEFLCQLAAYSVQARKGLRVSMRLANDPEEASLSMYNPDNDSLVVNLF